MVAPFETGAAPTTPRSARFYDGRIERAAMGGDSSDVLQAIGVATHRRRKRETQYAQ
jgi:hypothetical protein